MQSETASLALEMIAVESSDAVPEKNAEMTEKIIIDAQM